MNQSYIAELERQQLIKHCHSLIAEIANRPGAVKLLRGIVPTLERFARYKASSKRQRLKAITSAIK